ncbi:MAG: CoA-substrate-specific enzyme activase [Firmicutes bacterium]|nr:CoA-substrate-specific enzyme activase [Bacillota bacterium]
MDLGSRAVKLVLFEGGELREEKVVETAHFYKKCGVYTKDGFTVDFTGLLSEAPTNVTVTGYGRNSLNIAGATIISELKAHMLGAIWQTGLKDFTLLDLGGQDSKVIRVRNGRMDDFLLNDKCAASTGRYLENMAAVLGISLDELSGYYENPVELSATCAIFGESELIGRIVEGAPLPELAAGVNYSIFRRIKPMLVSLASDTIVFTGGVAIGGAVAHWVREEIGGCLVVPQHPQLNGAIGCARYMQQLRA